VHTCGQYSDIGESPPLLLRIYDQSQGIINIIIDTTVFLELAELHMLAQTVQQIFHNLLVLYTFAAYLCIHHGTLIRLLGRQFIIQYHSMIHNTMA